MCLRFLRDTFSGVRRGRNLTYRRIICSFNTDQNFEKANYFGPENISEKKLSLPLLLRHNYFYRCC